MRVQVLGCGPAGMMAAHAASLKGHDVQVVSQLAEPSRMGGAQYLHMPIPGVTGRKPETRILLVMAGDRAGYAKRVYGSVQAPVSWTRYEGKRFVDGWNLFDAYAKLWDLHGNRIDEAVVKANTLVDITEGADLVISTIPKTALCWQDHSFVYQEVWAAPEKPLDVGQRFSRDFIFYNGSNQGSYYRVSKLFGNEMTEWSMITNPKSEPPSQNAFVIRKPLTTDCDCWKPTINFIGRYGSWDKDQLVSDAWEDANALL